MTLDAIVTGQRDNALILYYCNTYKTTHTL